MQHLVQVVDATARRVGTEVRVEGSDEARVGRAKAKTIQHDELTRRD